ncbi:hypothetical protein AAF712_015432 [Marasmius tenuissimus]|uniref:Uncharacterized protein n=1 Tax=Marasmius tenuissimus TaxID=585030 RepID=A0ABR2Z999_9AGAR
MTKERIISDSRQQQQQLTSSTEFQKTEKRVAQLEDEILAKNAEVVALEEKNSPADHEALWTAQNQAKELCCELGPLKCHLDAMNSVQTIFFRKRTQAAMGVTSVTYEGEELTDHSESKEVATKDEPAIVSDGGEERNEQSKFQAVKLKGQPHAVPGAGRKRKATAAEAQKKKKVTLPQATGQTLRSMTKNGRQNNHSAQQSGTGRDSRIEPAPMANNDQTLKDTETDGSSVAKSFDTAPKAIEILDTLPNEGIQASSEAIMDVSERPVLPDFPPEEQAPDERTRVLSPAQDKMEVLEGPILPNTSSREAEGPAEATQVMVVSPEEMDKSERHTPEVASSGEKFPAELTPVPLRGIESPSGAETHGGKGPAADETPTKGEVPQASAADGSKAFQQTEPQFPYTWGNPQTSMSGGWQNSNNPPAQATYGMSWGYPYAHPEGATLHEVLRCFSVAGVSQGPVAGPSQDPMSSPPVEAGFYTNPAILKGEDGGEKVFNWGTVLNEALKDLWANAIWEPGPGPSERAMDVSPPQGLSDKQIPAFPNKENAEKPVHQTVANEPTVPKEGLAGMQPVHRTMANNPTISRIELTVNQPVLQTVAKRPTHESNLNLWVAGQLFLQIYRGRHQRSRGESKVKGPQVETADGR